MKILKEVYLSNWYGFVNEHIRFDKNGTFITGENESGKSTILDAIKYAYIGDSQFNKGAEAKGVKQRTLASYTRCLYNPSENRFYRMEDDVYTHIFMGYEDDGINGNGKLTKGAGQAFTMGCILHTNANNNVTGDWYIIEKPIVDVQFVKDVYVGTDVKHVAIIDKEFLELNGGSAYISHYGKSSQALPEFFRKLGMSFTPDEFKKYGENMRHMLAYNTRHKVVDFIKENVLRADNVDMASLKTSKRDFDNLQREMQKLLNEVQGLKKIEEAFNEYQEAVRRLKINEHKMLLHANAQSDREIANFQEQIKEGTRKKESLERELDNNKNKIHELEREISALRKALEGRGEPIEEIELRLSELKQKKGQLQKIVDKIDNIYQRLNEMASQNLISYSLLENTWTGMEYSVEQKEESLYAIRDAIDAKYKELLDMLTSAMNKKNSCQDDIDTVNEELSSLRNNSYRIPEGVRTLISAINAEFEKRGIDSKATYAAENVVDIIDEEWRDALEAHLGFRRFDVLVEKEYFSIASKVHEKLHPPKVKLVNTPRLFMKTYRVEENSAFHLLQIENKLARRYFEYLLGGVIACNNESNVPDYDNALAKTRRFSGGMCISYHDPVKDYCVGMQAIKLEREKKEQHKRDLYNLMAGIDNSIKNLNVQLEIVRSMNTAVSADLDFDAYNRISAVNKNIAAQSRKLDEARDAITSDTGYLSILNQKTEVERTKAAIEAKNQELTRNIGRIENEIEHAHNGIEELKANNEATARKLEASKEKNPDEAIAAEKEYAKYVQDVQSGKSIRPFVLHETLNKKKDEAYSKLMTLESKHQADFKNFNITVDEEELRESLSRVATIQVNDLEIAKNKLNAQQSALEDIFKNQIVSNIFSRAMFGKNTLKKMNEALRNLQFETEYQFSVRDIADGSDYDIILQYGKYLAQHHGSGEDIYSSAMMPDAYEQREMLERINEILERIASEETDEDYLNDLADYRNYMTYDITMKNKATGQSGYLSKDSGYNSGAGAQIPYTVIMTVALVAEYNKDPEKSTARIMFMDEPFEKMSSSNVKRMMDFFRAQNLQVIFCGASKMDCIGENCGVILPVLKKDRCHMTLGSVEYKSVA